MRPSQNLPLPPRIEPVFPQLCATLQDCTPPSKSSHPVKHLYETLPESGPLSELLYATLSESPPPPPPRIYYPFSTTICDPPRIDPQWKGEGLKGGYILGG